MRICITYTKEIEQAILSGTPELSDTKCIHSSSIRSTAQQKKSIKHLLLDAYNINTPTLVTLALK